jgi:RNA polymerase sigma factor (TIGR02999 family)
MESPLSTLILSAERGDRAERSDRSDLDRGGSQASEALFAGLYRELRGLARRELARSGPGAALGATSLLHEAYLDISKREGLAFPDRARFLGYAARVMRGLIIDGLRSRQARKRGGGFEITSIDGKDVGDAGPGGDAEEMERLGQALDELAAVEPEIAQVVDLKFFCGFTFTEIANLRGVSERTVQRHWDKARIYLRHAVRGGCAELLH